MKNSLYISIAAICLITLSWAIPFEQPSHGNTPERVKIALRNAGNELLLLDGDSSSLVLPVKEIGLQQFQLSFERDIAILPDSLVALLDSNFEKADLSKNYIVEVVRCKDQEISYSYQMHTNWDKTIVPCKGREVPEACHRIEVTFNDSSTTLSLSKVSIAALALGLLIFLGVRFRESVKLATQNPLVQEYETLGIFQFYKEQSKLVVADKDIKLSRKEGEILTLLATNVNQVVTREVITKAVWEDHGVIVGRSLDTYISKLRKKLEDDPQIKITNVHGVGYKLLIA
ncbi:winged helix-turn-helix domain-containing protein [Dokdonia sp. Hel_I_53]|uniref:winged helix-turn-helix domain-containing protein n=1 Tax=Dokdonia sp. Hel_I_53 TaxID=1566287 RepID=UPI0016440951|nr:winged helix-turn-helix domain-containing protein [Dokdonia sp. Hel_I_53]